MHPKRHIILGLIFSFSLFLIFENITFFPALVIWFSSWFFIDLDHAFLYAMKNKDINPVRFWRWAKQKGKEWGSFSMNKKNKYKFPVFIFHGIEFLIVVYFASLFFGIFLWVFIGCLFHLVLDWIDLVFRGENFFLKFSVVYVLVRNKNKKDFN